MKSADIGFFRENTVSSKFFTNEGANSLLNKFAGVFAANKDIATIGASLDLPFYRLCALTPEEIAHIESRLPDHSMKGKL